MHHSETRHPGRGKAQLTSCMGYVPGRNGVGFVDFSCGNLWVDLKGEGSKLPIKKFVTATKSGIGFIPSFLVKAR